MEKLRKNNIKSNELMKRVYQNCIKNIIKRNMKRHIDEVHLKKLDFCKLCGLKITRLSEHLKHCKRKKNYIKEDKTNFIGSDTTKCNNTNTGIIHVDKINFVNNRKDIFDVLNEKYENQFLKLYKGYLVLKDYKLGEGTFSKVYFGLDIKRKIPIALKVEKEPSSNELNGEKMILLKLQPYDCFPKIIEFKKVK